MSDALPLAPLAVAHGLTPSLTPAGLFVTGEDRIRVTTFNSAAGVTLALEGLVYLAGHGLRPFAERHVPNTDRTSGQSLFAIGEGWLQSVHLRASAGAPRRGQCFAILELVRGAATNAVVPLAVLAQGYVTDTQRRGWPASPLEMSTDGAGVLRSILGTDPAVNVEISETVPTNARWRVLAIDATLVTELTAATREADLVFDDGAAVLARVVPAATQAADLTRLYNWARDNVRISGSTSLWNTAHLPAVDLPSGARIRTITANLQANDNWSAPRLLVEEWIED